VLNIIKLSNNVPSNIYGGKAYGLALLFKALYRVPETIIIEACRDPELIHCDGLLDGLKKHLEYLRCGEFYDLAIRSSCTTEDSFEGSFAGHFDTFIGKMTFEDVICNIKKIILLALPKMQNATDNMAVIIQEKIFAEYSGVIFSSNPFNFSKNQMIISYTCGDGDKLVSGQDEGKDVIVNINEGQFTLSDQDNAPIINILIDLAKKTKELEKILNYPIDVEWAVVESKLFFLQCRPLASITKIKSTLQNVNKENVSLFPKSLVSHDKIQFRLFANEASVAVSDAYICIRNSYNDDAIYPLNILKSNYCIGHNAVLIYPEHIKGNVMRSFIGDEDRLFKNIPDCNSYTIHSYPKYISIGECIQDYVRITSENYWVTTTIVQEILNPIYTGIVQKTSEGYLVEITFGNFISKGVCETSLYLTDFKGNLLSAEEVNQTSWYQIVEGHVLLCTRDKDTLVTLSEGNLRTIIKFYNVIAKDMDIILEFGVLDTSPYDCKLFLMDFVNNNTAKAISNSDISEGIISRGYVSGKIVSIRNDSENSIDMHFYDTVDESGVNDEYIVFFCSKPDIALLKLLRNYASNKIGFVFQEGSVLCHFAVVLREKGIPSIKVTEIPEWFVDNAMCTIDAESHGLKGVERLSID
jgi:hypothetical protein